MPVIGLPAATLPAFSCPPSHTSCKQNTSISVCFLKKDKRFSVPALAPQVLSEISFIYLPNEVFRFLLTSLTPLPAFGLHRMFQMFRNISKQPGGGFWYNARRISGCYAPLTFFGGHWLSQHTKNHPHTVKYIQNTSNTNLMIC